MIPSGRTKIPQAVWRRKRRRRELEGWERKDAKGGKRRGGEERREEERKRKEGRKEGRGKKKVVVFLKQTPSPDALLTTPADFNTQECQDQWSRTNGDQTR